MKIAEEQIYLINYVKSYFKKLKTENIDQLKSVFCYFSIWSPSPGLSKLRTFKKSFFGNLNLFISTLKGMISISRQSNFIIINNNNKKNASKLIVTWAYNNNFLSNGSLQDRFFNTNSRSLKGCLWYVIYMDEKIPKKLDKNIILLAKKKTFFKYNLFYLIKIIFQNILYNNFSIKKIFHSLSSNITISNLITGSIIKEIETEKINKIILPYEAQPFQRNLIHALKEKNKKMISVGYIHDLMPFPIYYAPLDGLPDILLVHSSDQKKYFTKYMGWPKKNIKLIPSMRFIKKNKNLGGKIFLPHTIVNFDRITSEFENFLQNSKKKSIQKLNIKIHPTSENIKDQLKLKFNLESIMKNYSDRFSNSIKYKLAVVIGLTSVVVEILENDIKVLHICGEPLFESYTELFWPNIKVNPVNKYAYFYKIAKKSASLRFGKKADQLKKYC